jgi:NADPH-dependent 2,4-dienoyl-CoA reductase/sulfur reductase-like enzyme
VSDGTVGGGGDRENFSVFTPHQATVHDVDIARRRVVAGHCAMCADSVIEDDYLVLALGAVTNFFGLPGVATHAMTVKSLADAAALRDPARRTRGRRCGLPPRAPPLVNVSLFNLTS